MIPEKEIKGGVAADRILAAAERLFSSKGFNVSLRNITAAAGANIAAVNYYFGSKTKLAEALFDKLSSRVNAKRLQELEDVLGEASAQGRKPELRKVLRAFVRPYLDPCQNGQLLARLILQHRIEPSELTRVVIKRHFDPMADRFIEALRLCCPDVEPVAFFWRYAFMIGSVVLTVTDTGPGNRLERISKGAVDQGDLGQFEGALLDFLCGAMSAPDEERVRNDGDVARAPLPPCERQGDLMADVKACS